MTILRSLIVTYALIVGTPAIAANTEKEGAGMVAETMTSGGYVYVRLEEDDRWVASTPIPISLGDKVSYADGMTMKDFMSRTLDRTFDYIIFAGILKVVTPATADVHGHVNSKMSDDLGIKKSETTIAPKSGEITPVDGGKTIAGIRGEYKQLEDQHVALRARVMKVSKNILGKNWITLQDGSAPAPNDKLIATSSELVEIGDVVTVNGVIKTDVDLGSGYKYKVVIEEAAFSR